MVSYKARCYQKSDNTGFVGADIILESDTDVTNVTVMDANALNNYKQNIDSTVEKCVKVSSDALKDTSLERILSNNNNILTNNGVSIDAQTLSGYDINDLSLVGHVHSRSNITDFFDIKVELVGTDRSTPKYNAKLGDEIYIKVTATRPTADGGIIYGEGIPLPISSSPPSLVSSVSQNTSVTTGRNGSAYYGKIKLTQSGIATFTVGNQTVQCNVSKVLNTLSIDDYGWKEVEFDKELPPVMRGKLFINEAMELANVQLYLPRYLGWCANNDTSSDVLKGENRDRETMPYIAENSGYVNSGGSKAYSFHGVETRFIIPNEYLPPVPMSQVLFKGEWVLHLDGEGTFYGSAMSFTSEGSNLFSSTKKVVTSNWSIDLVFNHMWWYGAPQMVERPNLID